MRIATLAEIRNALDEREAIAAIEEGFRLYSAGRVQLSAVGHLGFGEGEGGDCHVKAAHLDGDALFVVKVATGFYGNAVRGLPSSNGFMALLSAETGAPVALLLDEGHLTDLRTAMAGAIAARLIARPGSATLGIVGTGVQAELQARLIARHCGLDSVRIWGRRAEAVEALASRLGDSGLDAGAAASVEGLCAEADLLVTTTPSRTPIVTAAMLRPGARIVAVGADAPGKGELDPAIIETADLVIADSHEQCLAHGEISAAHRAGRLDRAKLRELGGLIGEPLSVADDAIVIVDLTGLGVQDAQIAKAVYARLWR